MKKLPAILARHRVATGKHLTLDNVEFTDDRGRCRLWEAAGRVGSPGAVGICATIEPDGKVLLVRQYRPPAERFLIEFPAGLIDAGESPAETAVRELYEETGYTGKVVKVHLPSYSSPGMTGETITLVEMLIDGDAYRDRPPEPHPEDSESIECLAIRKSELDNFLAERVAAGDGVDAKLLIYAALHKK